jgi:TP901 family phage tail tape measure protein
MSIDLIARLRLVDEMSSRLRRVAGGLGSFSGKVIGASAAIAGLGAGITAAAVAVKSLSKAMDFEAQMSSIAALTGATNKEMEQMQALALKMGAATKYNALEAAQGIEELLKAGLSPATVQAGGLEAALNLATAGGLDLAAAAEIMSTALNAFQEDGMTAAQAADILAGTANASATSVEELRYSLSMTSAVAAGLGMNFEDTNVALGLFANRGLKGSDAGTSLKTMLQTLQPVTDDQIELFKALGLVTADGSNQFFDAAGNIKSLNDIAGTLRKSMAKLTNQERQHALKLMFGTDAVRAATILFKEGAEGVDKFRDEMSKVTALDVARKKMDNAAGAVEQFHGALETLQISGMTPLLPIIKDMANAAADFIEKYSPQIVAGMQSMVDKAKAYVKKNFIDNPEFQKLTTLESKIKFIFNTLMDDFNKWWNESGAASFQKITEKITSVMVDGLSTAVPRLTEVGLKLGKGLVSGIIAAIKEDPVASAVMFGGAGGAVAGLPGAVIAGGGAAAVAGYNSMKTTGDLNDKFRSGQMTPEQAAEYTRVSQELADKSVWSSIGGMISGKGHAGGLRNVPYNNYPAQLHAGEAVLTREEAKRWRGEGGASGGSGSVVITGNTFHVREEADIEKIARQLAYQMAQ